MKNKKKLFIFLNVFLVLTLSLILVQGALVNTYEGSIESSPNSEDSSTINFGSPYTYCGDGKLNLNKKEQCDLYDIGENSCATFGFEGGVLSCFNLIYEKSCTLDFSGCYDSTSTTSTENPTTTNSGGGGSSTTSSGGASGSSECIIAWVCEEWEKCENGVQNRVCVDLNSCGTDELKPAEERSCINEGVSGDEATMEGYEKPSFFQMTGNAISDSFTKSGYFLGWIVVILTVGGLFFLLFWESDKKKEETPESN